MASKRFIPVDFWDSEKVASWPFFERLFFQGLCAKAADDQGRMKGHPALLRSTVFPYDDIPLEEILAALSRFEDSKSILIYEEDGTRYIQILNWWKWQSLPFAWPSKYPAPEGWTDRVKYRKGNRVIKENWFSSSQTNDGEVAVEPRQDDVAEPQLDGATPGEPTASPPRGHDGVSVGSAPSTSTGGSSSASTGGSTSSGAGGSSSSNTGGQRAPPAADAVPASASSDHAVLYGALRQFGMNDIGRVLRANKLPVPDVLRLLELVEEDQIQSRPKIHDPPAYVRRCMEKGWRPHEGQGGMIEVPY